jgi:hypothetical protein
MVDYTLKIVYYSVHKIAPLNVVVSPMDPLHIIAYHLFKVHSLQSDSKCNEYDWIVMQIGWTF